jgi:hypothetical protein
MTTEQRALLKHQHDELKQCLALLADAIARAERSYARWVAELSSFDRRATATVDRLRMGHCIGAAVVWDP